jgi:hypothetical protein
VVLEEVERCASILSKWGLRRDCRGISKKEFECKLKIYAETAGKLLQRITATLTCETGGGVQRTMN